MRAVYGHQQAQARLERTVLGDAVSHAWLLTGPSGIGKTTLAMEFARLLQCTGRDSASGEPCGECASCRKISHHNHPDVTLIEPKKGKRTLGIEQVRDMIRTTSLAPTEGRWRIFVIPEIERMLLPAMNSLLKTLEEPAPQVVLLLTSSEPETLLPTVLSRCQIVPMLPLAPDEVTQALIEQWLMPESEARALAMLANGRLGWAIRAAEKPELREQRIHELEEIADLAAAPRDERLRRVGSFGKDVESAQRVLELWTLWWRDVVLAASGASHLATTGDLRTKAERLGSRLGLERARHFLRALLDAQLALEANANPRLTLEVLALDLPAMPAQTQRGGR
ncbi:MAG TPA: DNA polymerase III subunit delta' [Ktedonobacterales bacterium]|nr:DNA polymerase III subunit delta' [Ktedonobacterales bacterium]